MVYRCYADDCFYHSSGPWKKHKYIKKVGNKYVYANNGSTSSYKLRGEAAGKKARAFIQKMRAKVAEYHSIGKQLVDGFINGLLGRSTVPAGPISAKKSVNKSPSGRPTATSAKKKDTVKGGGPTTRGVGSLAKQGTSRGVDKIKNRPLKSNKEIYTLERKKRKGR